MTKKKDCSDLVAQTIKELSNEFEVRLQEVQNKFDKFSKNLEELEKNFEEYEKQKNLRRKELLSENNTTI